MNPRWSLAAFAVVAAIGALAPSESAGEDPLDDVTGTEEWSERDSSAVDEDVAWGRWRRELARWEAGRARIESERARMSQLAQRLGRAAPTEVLEEHPAAGDWQARIDAARRTVESGGPAQRDADGQHLDTERPWNRR
jgi:hypothetical protein